VTASPRPIREIAGVSADVFACEIAAHRQPVVIRGLAKDWPLVAAAQHGASAVADYLGRFDCGTPTRVMRADPIEGGRFFYTPDMHGFNFTSADIPLTVLMRELIRISDAPAAPALYAGSSPTEQHLPGFADANPMPLVAPDATPRIWIGNATHISAHYDVSENIAVVAMGRRRFTLFPPDQLPNMYAGPLDMTIAGQPVSMVDLRAPDFDRFPRFAEALSSAQAADLGPGDAIYIPTMWWHNVVATEPFNVLVNYWYGQQSGGSPFVAMLHAMQVVRDLAPADRQAWRQWFEHYVFSDEAGSRASHLPPHAHGVLGQPSPAREQEILAYLRGMLFPE
jgi:hypothetical protein